MHLSVTLTLAAVSLTAGIVAYLITVRPPKRDRLSDAEAMQAACKRAAANTVAAYTLAALPKKP